MAVTPSKIIRFEPEYTPHQQAQRAAFHEETAVAQVVSIKEARYFWYSQADLQTEVALDFTGGPDGYSRQGAVTATPISPEIPDIVNATVRGIRYQAA